MTGPATRLSVVMPNYNHGSLLDVSVGGILAQSQQPDEIIIVNDGSTDNSAAVLAGFAARDARIRIITHEARQGVVAAVNRGIAEATGEFVMLASADERMTPKACATLMAALADNPDSRLVVSAYTQWRPETNTVTVHGRDSDLGLWFMGPGEAQRHIAAHEFEAILRDRFAFLSINTAIFRREALVEAGCYDPGLRWHADWFLIYAIALRHGFTAVNQSLVWFRVDERSYSALGMRQASQQRAVAEAIQTKLRDPAFADVRAALLRAPSAMSPFMRGTLMSLATSPRNYDAFFAILGWWLGEAARGRRPGVVKRLTERFRKPPCAQQEVHR